MGIKSFRLVITPLARINHRAHQPLEGSEVQAGLVSGLTGKLAVGETRGHYLLFVPI